MRAQPLINCRDVQASSRWYQRLLGCFGGHGGTEGTAIELANDNNTGATQVSAAEFLGITYPTGDVLAAMEAIGPGRGQPVVLIGERGQGKSHLLAALYHGFPRRSSPPSSSTTRSGAFAHG